MSYAGVLKRGGTDKQNLYHLCGVRLQADIEFPELNQASGEAAEFTFEVNSTRFARREEHYSLLHEWCFPNGDRWLSIGKAGPSYVLTFPAFATFIVSADATHVACEPNPYTPPDTIRHLFLDQVVPLLLSARGKLVLHASGVAGPEGTLGFIGVAGAGKSTMAASFLADGYTIVTDDCLIVEPANRHFAVRPNYPGLRLWPETAEAVLGSGITTSDVAHYTRKKRVAATQSQAECLPLRRLYLLTEPDNDSGTIAVETLPPGEAFMELVKYTFRLDVSDRNKLAEEFASFSRLVSKGYVKRLRYPRELNRLAEVKSAILADARGE